MINGFSYYMPSKVFFDAALADNIVELTKNRRLLLVTTKGTLKRGLYKKIQSINSQIAGIIDQVPSHPDLESLKGICIESEKYKFDTILAVGGGSVIDTAKFISSFLYKRDFSLIEKVLKNEASLSGTLNIPPIIAVPTTAGTSSEITPWATIWDMKEKRKYSLHLPELFPEKAIYDPSLTQTLSKELTIQTSLDALSHSLESIWNKNANPLTIDFAIKSAKLVIAYLPKVIEKPNDLSYRKNLMQASMYAGFAFSNTQTSIAHAISYYITAEKGVPHGIACSFTLPMIIDQVITKFDYVDNALIDIFGELSSTPLRKLFDSLNISVHFKDYGLNKDDLLNIENSLRNNQRAGNGIITINFNKG
jgi:phosphonate metabolism-associated iron-containing alcohol dehydrogenase